VVRQNRLHPRESPYYLEIEKGLQHNTWRRRITSLKLYSQLSCCTCSCCHCSPSLSLLVSLLHSQLSLILLSLPVPFYRQQWCHQLLLFFNKDGCQLQLFFNNGSCQPLTSWMGAHDRCNSSCSCCNYQWLLHINGNQPNMLYSYRIYQVQKEVENSSYWTTALACQNSVRQCSRYAQDIIKQYVAYQLTAYNADASTKTSFCKLSQETTFSWSINELWGSHKPTTFARIEHHKCFMC